MNMMNRLFFIFLYTACFVWNGFYPEFRTDLCGFSHWKWQTATHRCRHTRRD